MATMTATKPAAMPDYTTPLEQHPAMKQALDALAAAAKASSDLEAKSLEAIEAMRHGDPAELDFAEEQSPSVDQLRRARLVVTRAAAWVSAERARLKSEREAAFRDYARREVVRLARDLRNVLERNRQFSAVAALRVDAGSPSGSYGVASMDNPSLPQLEPMVDQFVSFWATEYNVEL